MDEENPATVPRSLQKAGVKASCRNDHYPVFAPHVLQGNEMKCTKGDRGSRKPKVKFGEQGQRNGNDGKGKQDRRKTERMASRKRARKGAEAGKKTSSLKDRKSDVIHGKKVGWLENRQERSYRPRKVGSERLAGRNMRSSVEAVRFFSRAGTEETETGMEPKRCRNWNVVGGHLTGRSKGPNVTVRKRQGQVGGCRQNIRDPRRKKPEAKNESGGDHRLYHLEVGSEHVACLVRFVDTY